jgi:hypothetical protein
MKSVCEVIHRFAHGLRRYHFPFDPSDLPCNGVYILFEDGELAHGGDRIVRIGSHTGAGRLAKRLNEHFLVPNKDRSIFRKNIGRALLNRAHDPFLRQWEWDFTTRAVREKYQGVHDAVRQECVEKEVSDYIRRNFSFALLPMTENKELRLGMEKGIIATVASCPSCHPSSTWLGLSSPRPAIRRSGLWLVQHLKGMPLQEFPPGGLTFV